jgi:formylglycine-generating enzyme required for sulfatase activity
VAAGVLLLLVLVGALSLSGGDSRDRTAREAELNRPPDESSTLADPAPPQPGEVVVRSDATEGVLVVTPSDGEPREQGFSGPAASLELAPGAYTVALHETRLMEGEDLPLGPRIGEAEVVVTAGATETTTLNRRCPEGMVYIPGGTFQMGSPEGEGGSDERPQHAVTLSAYCLDRTEVTVSAYAECVAEGDCREPSRGSGRFARYYNWGHRAERGSHPVNGVSWEDARTYCAFRSLRLPTEAEWEYAARGSDGRTYPWGPEAPTEARLPSSLHCGEWGCAGGTSAVGTHPTGASPFGVEDLAGNVWEWVSDRHGDYPSEPQTDPTGPASGRSRVYRGGSWDYGLPSYVRAAIRSWFSPSRRFDYLGFRCARGG